MISGRGGPAADHQRLDIGYRVPGLQRIGNADRLGEDDPEEFSFFGLFEAPIAIHLAFGEAF